MIHYHGLPITPTSACIAAISRGHAFISHQHPDQVGVALEVAQSFALDNGAFSAWKSGAPIADWSPFYTWVDQLRRHPGFDFDCIPDVIGGTERENDELLAAWPFGPHVGAPVWHMHETLARLDSLLRDFPRVCIGSSGAFSHVGGAPWWQRIDETMRVACDSLGRPRRKLHGLRMLSRSIFSRLPLSSADSTTVGRCIGLDSRWRGPYADAGPTARAIAMRDRIESGQSAEIWTPQPLQEVLALHG